MEKISKLEQIEHSLGHTLDFLFLPSSYVRAVGYLKNENRKLSQNRHIKLPINSLYLIASIAETFRIGLYIKIFSDYFSF